MNTKADIPADGSSIPNEDTDLSLPDLPGEWTWGTVNHYEMTHKVNVFFGRNAGETGGQYGEIDNFIQDDEEKWTLHVRPIVDAPNAPHGNIPRETAETSETFDTLDAAIEAVPAHIATHYK